MPKPSILHSLILGEAIKVEQNTPLQFRIRDFIRIWGLENLREEDWEQYRSEEGNTLPSTVEKLIGVYTKELKTDGVESLMISPYWLIRLLQSIPRIKTCRILRLLSLFLKASPMKH